LNKDQTPEENVIHLENVRGAERCYVLLTSTMLFEKKEGPKKKTKDAPRFVTVQRSKRNSLCGEERRI